jgi:integrase
VARPRSLKPAYCHHKASGRAFVTIDGRRVYLGRFGTPESRDEYDRVIGEWIARGRRPEPRPSASAAGAFTVTSLIAAFWRHAERYYVAPVLNPDGAPDTNPDGSPKVRPTGELDNFRWALGPLRRLYGKTAAAEFGPLKLKAVRAEMLKPREVIGPQTGHNTVRRGWCRTHVNRQIKRIRQVFAWGVSEELVPATTYQALLTVRAVPKGRTDARESAPVRPVSDDRVAATLPRLSPVVQAMVKCQRLTGARPGEVCAMRTRDIEKRDGVWVYRPRQHKTAQHDIVREIYIGPKAQAVLAPYLRDDPDAHVFSPLEAECRRREQQRKDRDSEPTASQVRRDEKAAKRAHLRKRAPKGHYTVRSYRRAIARACEVAFTMPADCRWTRDDLPVDGDTPEQLTGKAKVRAEKAIARARWHEANVWHPHQLRHAAATRVREGYGLEAAAAVLGHAEVTTTQIYAERDARLAHRVAQEVG